MFRYIKNGGMEYSNQISYVQRQNSDEIFQKARKQKSYFSECFGMEKDMFSFVLL